MNQMNFTQHDAWGQRENQDPPQHNEPELETVEVHLKFKWNPKVHEHPQDWKWEDILDAEGVEVTWKN